MKNMRGILNRICKLVRYDGFLHIETCLTITLVFGWLLPWWWTGGIVAMCAGVGKEIWDRKHGACDWHDIICDIIGVVLGMLILFVKIYL